MVDQSVLKIKILEEEKGVSDQSEHNTEVVAQEEPQDVINDKTLGEVQVPENNENEEISIS